MASSLEQAEARADRIRVALEQKADIDELQRNL